MRAAKRKRRPGFEARAANIASPGAPRLGEAIKGRPSS
jgi:hypothetical protein